MKYSNYEMNEYGYSIKGHSKFLQFILNFYCKKISRKFKKIHKLPKDTKVNVSAEINFTIDLGEKK